MCLRSPAVKVGVVGVGCTQGRTARASSTIAGALPGQAAWAGLQVLVTGASSQQAGASARSEQAAMWQHIPADLPMQPATGPTHATCHRTSPCDLPQDPPMQPATGPTPTNLSSITHVARRLLLRGEGVKYQGNRVQVGCVSHVPLNAAFSQERGCCVASAPRCHHLPVQPCYVQVPQISSRCLGCSRARSPLLQPSHQAGRCAEHELLQLLHCCQCTLGANTWATFSERAATG
jgi:hypothetical protein